jgi:hypothetical protein
VDVNFLPEAFQNVSDEQIVFIFLLIIKELFEFYRGRVAANSTDKSTPGSFWDYVLILIRFIWTLLIVIVAMVVTKQNKGDIK